MNVLLQRLRQFLLAVLLGLFSLVYPIPVQADAGAFLTSQTYAELQASLEQTRDPKRLADLQALEEAIAASDDRAQLTNQTTHNLGVFARYKKDPADAPAQFYVLAPGHATDDDYELLGLLVPPQVSLAWADTGKISPASSPRVLRLLEGEQLAVSEPAAAETSLGDVIYQLSLPAFSVEASLAFIPELPAINQLQLDQDVETAPVD